jgi:hypothetical protein
MAGEGASPVPFSGWARVAHGLGRGAQRWRRSIGAIAAGPGAASRSTCHGVGSADRQAEDAIADAQQQSIVRPPSRTRLMGSPYHID